jgi:hypothetical protein
MPVSDDNIRKPITLPKDLHAELCREAEKSGMTLSEVIRRYLTSAKQAREQWETQTQETLSHLSDEVHGMAEVLRTLVDRVHDLVKQLQPPEHTPETEEPPFPVATYEDMYGSQETEERTEAVPVQHGEPGRHEPKKRWFAW